MNAARDLGYPVLMRPSYVLGGQNMIIAYCDEDIEEYMAIILSHKQDNPVLIDKYLSGMEIEVDAICDGENTSLSPALWSTWSARASTPATASPCTPPRTSTTT